MVSIVFALLFVVVMAALIDWAMGKWYWPDRRSFYHDLRESDRFRQRIEHLGRAVERAPSVMKNREIEKSRV